MTREVGYYWIRSRESLGSRLGPEWRVGKWTGVAWHLAGLDEEWSDEPHRFEVGDRVVRRGSFDPSALDVPASVQFRPRPVIMPAHMLTPRMQEAETLEQMAEAWVADREALVPAAKELVTELLRFVDAVPAEGDNAQLDYDVDAMVARAVTLLEPVRGSKQLQVKFQNESDHPLEAHTREEDGFLVFAIRSPDRLPTSERASDIRTLYSMRWAMQRFVELRKMDERPSFRVTWRVVDGIREYRLEIRREDGTVERPIWPMSIGGETADVDSFDVTAKEQGVVARCLSLASVMPEHMKALNAAEFDWSLNVGGFHVAVSARPMGEKEESRLRVGMLTDEGAKNPSTPSQLVDEEYNVGNLLRAYWRGQFGKAELMAGIEKRVDQLVPEKRS